LFSLVEVRDNFKFLNKNILFFYLYTTFEKNYKFGFNNPLVIYGLGFNFFKNFKLYLGLNTDFYFNKDNTDNIKCNTEFMSNSYFIDFLKFYNFKTYFLLKKNNKIEISINKSKFYNLLKKKLFFLFFENYSYFIKISKFYNIKLVLGDIFFNIISRKYNLIKYKKNYTTLPYFNFFFLI
jgi:hypothetical protein